MPPRDSDYPKPQPVNQNKQMSLGSEFDVLHKINPHILKEMHPVYQAGYEKAKKIVDGNRIHIDEFTNYADLEKDKSAVAEKIRNINSGNLDDGNMEAIVQAEILEALVHDMIQKYKWFGPNSGSILPSSYDDLFLGNDIILEQKLEGDNFSYSGVGIDITLGEVSFGKKLEITKRKLEQGKLGKVKYFQSPKGNFKGELNNIPHFVIGIDREKLFKLTSLWIRDDVESFETLKREGTNKMLLQMMIAECDEFSKIGGFTVREAYQREKKILQKMLTSIS